jgi:hypothetical protein
VRTTDDLHGGDVSGPTRELLAWVSVRTRTYPETIDAWRTSCPRLTVWEDALADGLVRVVRDPRGRASLVAVTDRGRVALSTT